MANSKDSEQKKSYTQKMNKNKGIFRAFYDYEEGSLILSTFLNSYKTQIKQGKIEQSWLQINDSYEN